MSRKRRRQPSEPGAPVDDTYRPKQGPGQVIKREMIAEVGGGHAKAKRYRNIGASPLILAYERGALACDAERAWRADPQHNRPPGIIAEDRKLCAEKFEKWWYERMASPNRDSSQPSIPGGGHRSMTETQQLAGEQVRLLRDRMASRNYLIVEGLVGMGHTMVEALRYAGVEVHPVGTAFRVREALDDLVCAITGRQLVPILVPGPVRKGA